jgi:hypothetical protein
MLLLTLCPLLYALPFPFQQYIEMPRTPREAASHYAQLAAISAGLGAVIPVAASVISGHSIPVNIMGANEKKNTQQSP